MRKSILVCVGMALAGQASPGVAAGDPATGKALAERWCSTCHLVTSEQTSATTEAPPFASIAARHADSMEALAAFLADPHPPMPEMSLSRQEISDLVAYMGSMK